MYTEGKNFSQQVRFAIKFWNFELNKKFLLILLEVFKLLEIAFNHVSFQLQKKALEVFKLKLGVSIIYQRL